MLTIVAKWSLLILGFLIAFTLTSYAQEPQAFKVKSPYSQNFDRESVRNLRYLQQIARQNGKVMVWIVTKAPYDPGIDLLHSSYTDQLRILGQYRDRIAAKLEIAPDEIQSVADGPYFAADLDATQLQQLFRTKLILGFWGFENAGYVSDN